MAFKKTMTYIGFFNLSYPFFFSIISIWKTTRWTLVLYRAHTHRSTIRHLWRCYKRLLKHRQGIFPTYLCTNQHEPFFERLSNCAGSNEDISFFTAKCSCNIECMLVGEMFKDGSISRYVTWRSCIITSHTTSMFSGTTAVFGRPSRTSRLSER